ncbi:MAG: GDP-6-deoxy-D-mannose reductase [Syntrophaceae bacterium PtaU1.Bin231]|nr:MAG: GDP-6-deoxy-D-mannose reductase [Syntrophaceae bacterium PtaU1.Bin231]
MPKRLLKTPPSSRSTLVTGGRGLLGRHLLPLLRRRHSAVTLYEGDVREISGLRARHDLVVHLAAKNKVDPASPHILFDTNVTGTLAVMEYCRRVGARCLFASSSGVYRPLGKAGRLDEGAELNPVTPYGTSKLLAENVCRFFAETHGLTVTTLRIFNMYGPGQDPDFVVPDLRRQLARSSVVTMRTPHLVRDFVHVRDVAKAFLAAADLDRPGFLTLNVGTGRGHSIRQVLTLLDGAASIRADEVERTDEDHVVADIGRIVSLAGWAPAVSLESALRRGRRPGGRKK